VVGVTTHMVELDDRDVAAVDRALRTRSAMLRELGELTRDDTASAENHAVSHVSMLLLGHVAGRCECSAEALSE
jgi:hypothetical protein